MALWIDIVIVTAFALLLAAAWMIGQAIGRQLRRPEMLHAQLGALQGATFGLLSLLLGLCFSGAISRFVERQHILVREANAITTLYQRAGFLDSPAREELQGLVRDYAHVRVKLFHASRLHGDDDLQARVRDLRLRMQGNIRQGAASHPEALMLAANAFTDLCDAFGERNAAERGHVPAAVAVVLFASALTSIALISVGLVVSEGRLRVPAIALAIVIIGALWTTVDLDFPRRGVIRVNPQPLIDALEEVGGGEPAR